MKKSSSKKHILAGVIFLVIVGVAFFLGWFTGTNVPLYTTESSTSETVDSIPVLDKIGGGNPILKREFWGLPFGASRHDVQTRMDRLGEFDFLKSEN